MCSKSKVISTTRGNTKKLSEKSRAERGKQAAITVHCVQDNSQFGDVQLLEHHWTQLWYTSVGTILAYSARQGARAAYERVKGKKRRKYLTACCPSGESRKESTENVLVRWCTGCCYCCCSGVIEGNGDEDKNTMSVHIDNRLNRALCK